MDDYELEPIYMDIQPEWTQVLANAGENAIIGLSIAFNFVYGFIDQREAERALDCCECHGGVLLWIVAYSNIILAD